MSGVHGLNELSKALKRLPGRVQKNVATGAIRAGASSIAKEAKKNLKPHKRTGEIEKSIAVVRRKSNDKNRIVFSVVPRSSKGGWKAHFLEFGTSKMPPIPFLRPAYENKGPEAINEAKKYMQKRIPKEIEKAKK